MPRSMVGVLAAVGAAMLRSLHLLTVVSFGC